MKIKRMIGVAAMAVMSVAGLVGVASPAQADFNGYCGGWDIQPTMAWGWCDGTGPQRYYIWVKCTDGGWYHSSIAPWFGDRRGAWAQCPPGRGAIDVGWSRA
jgi:hypothetical protein